MRQINVTLDTPIAEMRHGDYFVVTDGYHDPIAIVVASTSGSAILFYACSKWDRFSGANCAEWINDEWRYNWAMTSRSVATVADLIRYTEREKHLTADSLQLLTSGATARPVTPAPESSAFFHKNYACDVTYEGVRSYHSHHGGTMNAPKKSYSGHKIGVELEVECNSSSAYDKVKSITSNWVYMETDGSLSCRGVELITIPLVPSDAKAASTWSPLIAYLTKYAKSWSKTNCGLHVHIGREILGKTAEQQSETIGKMLFLYHHWLKDCAMNRAIYGRLRGYSDQDGKAQEADAARTLGKEVFKSKKLKDTVKKALIDKNSRGRYFDINLSNAATIEFRRGRGSINSNRITAVIEYCELICKYAKQAKWENICEADFVAYCRKKIAPTSPLARWITSEEACE